jgi:hypothetical protein
MARRPSSGNPDGISTLGEISILRRLVNAESILAEIKLAEKRLTDILAALLELEPALSKYHSGGTVYRSTYLSEWHLPQVEWDLPGMKSAIEFRKNEALAQKYNTPVVKK